MYLDETHITLAELRQIAIALGMSTATKIGKKSDMVRAIETWVGQTDKSKPEPPTVLMIGDKVSISGGAYAGYQGVIIKLPKKGAPDWYTVRLNDNVGFALVKLQWCI